MKRISKILLCAVLVLMIAVSSGLAALADVIVIPEDDFLNSHLDKCTHLYRQYLTNGEDGYVPAFRRPGSEAETAAITNGTLIGISYTYEDGDEVWGYFESYDVKNAEGWIRLSDLECCYDYISFREDHADEIGGSVTLEYEAQNRLVFWTYPLSGNVYDTMYLRVFDSLQCSESYTDPAGRLWGFITYWCGMRNLWVCLSDPYNEELPDDFAVHSDTLIPAVPVSSNDPDADIVSVSSFNALPFVLIGTGVAVAAVLVISTRKRRKNQADR